METEQVVLRNGRKGDRKPRLMRAESLQNIRQATPGYVSTVVRVFGPVSDIRWFEGLSSRERGLAVAEGRKYVERL